MRSDASARQSYFEKILHGLNTGQSSWNGYQHNALFLAGPDLLVSRLSGRMTYSLLLGLGVYVSMIREQGRRGHPALAPGLSTSFRRWRARIGVWLFFAILHVWNVDFQHLTWSERWRFCLGLTGL